MSEAGLLEAYRRFKDSAAVAPKLQRRASAPLLVRPGHRWFGASERLLIVGQETNGWSSTDGTLRSLEQFYERADGVETMLEAYSDFDFASSYRHRNSAFWRAFRLLTQNRVALWTNLFRTDVDGPVLLNCCASEQAELLKAQRALLREEVNELAPSVVLFLTGPRYDPALFSTFPEATIQPLWSDVPQREIAVITCSVLPIRTVRLYHPTYLQRSRRWHLLDRLQAWL